MSKKPLTEKKRKELLERIGEAFYEIMVEDRKNAAEVATEYFMNELRKCTDEEMLEKEKEYLYEE